MVCFLCVLITMFSVYGMFSVCVNNYVLGVWYVFSVW